MTTAEHQTAVTTFTPAELYARILRDEPTFILDVRNEDEARRSPIEGKSNLTSANIPYFAFLEDGEERRAGLAGDRQRGRPGPLRPLPQAHRLTLPFISRRHGAPDVGVPPQRAERQGKPRAMTTELPCGALAAPLGAVQ